MASYRAITPLSPKATLFTQTLSFAVQPGYLVVYNNNQPGPLVLWNVMRTQRLAFREVGKLARIGTAAFVIFLNRDAVAMWQAFEPINGVAPPIMP